MAEQLPVWNNPGIEPSTDLKVNGWQPGQKPSAQHFNWLFNRAYKCLEDLQNNKADKTAITNLSQTLSDLEESFTSHLAERNPHGTTASDVGAVNKKGDTMTGTLTLPSLVLQNGSKIMENAEQRLVILAHKNRLDVITEDNQKHMFRHMNGDLFVYDENGSLIDSFKNMKQAINKIPNTEKGVWTPLIRGDTTAGTPVYAGQNGEYVRNGDTLYVRGLIVLSSKGGMSGNLEIAGLPMVAKGGYRVATIGVHNNITYPDNAKSISGYIEGNVMRPYFNISGSTALRRVTATDVTDSMLLTFSAVYDI